MRDNERRLTRQIDHYEMLEAEAKERIDDEWERWQDRKVFIYGERVLVKMQITQRQRELSALFREIAPHRAGYIDVVQ
jgi:hypothetical protein